METIFRIIYWIRIAASPILLFGIAALVVFLTVKSPFNLFIAIPLFGFGIILGILLAERARKNGGTIEFISSISSSDDLNELTKKK